MCDTISIQRYAKARVLATLATCDGEVDRATENGRWAIDRVLQSIVGVA